MIGMEITMNSVDFILNGEPVINIQTIAPVLLAGLLHHYHIIIGD